MIPIGGDRTGGRGRKGGFGSAATSASRARFLQGTVSRETQSSPDLASHGVANSGLLTYFTDNCCRFPILADRSAKRVGLPSKLIRVVASRRRPADAGGSEAWARLSRRRGDACRGLRARASLRVRSPASSRPGLPPGVRPSPRRRPASPPPPRPPPPPT